METNENKNVTSHLLFQKIARLPLRKKAPGKRKQGIKVGLKTLFRKELCVCTETWNLVEANRAKVLSNF